MEKWVCCEGGGGNKGRKRKSKRLEEKESGQSKSEAHLTLEYSTFEDQHKLKNRRLNSSYCK